MASLTPRRAWATGSRNGVVGPHGDFYSPIGPGTTGGRGAPGGYYAPLCARLEPGDSGEHGRHDQQRGAQPDEDPDCSHGPSI